MLMRLSENISKVRLARKKTVLPNDFSSIRALGDSEHVVLGAWIPHNFYNDRKWFIQV